MHFAKWIGVRSILPAVSQLGRLTSSLHEVASFIGSHFSFSINFLEKMFKMRGTQEQIEHARQLISEKIGVEINILSTRQIGNSGGGGGGGSSNNSGQYGMQGNNPAMYGQQQQQQQWAGYQQQMWDQSQQQMPVSAAGQPDYSGT